MSHDWILSGLTCGDVSIAERTWIRWYTPEAKQGTSRMWRCLQVILWLRLLEDVCSLEYATLIRWLSKKIHGFGYGQGSLV